MLEHADDGAGIGECHGRTRRSRTVSIGPRPPRPGFRAASQSARLARLAKSKPVNVPASSIRKASGRSGLKGVSAVKQALAYLLQ